MKHITSLLPVLAIAVLLAACQAPEPSGMAPVVDVEAQKEAIRAAYDGFVTALMNDNPQEGASYFLEDAVRMPPAGYEDAVGRDAIEATWVNTLNVFKIEVYDVIDGVEVSGDLGVSWGRWDNLLILKADSSVTYRLGGKFANVWKMDSTGAWKSERMIWNLSEPLPAGFREALE